MYIQLNRNKKKKKQFDDEKLNEEETAKIYAEYVRTFEGGNDLDNRHKFVKGKGLNPSSKFETLFEEEKFQDETCRNNQQKIDKKIQENKNTEEIIENKNNTVGKVKEIDSFLEEIKLKQKILDERKILKEKSQLAKSEEEKKKINKKITEIEQNENLSSYIQRKEKIANLYLGNLSPEVTEEYLCQKFGKFGKVNSVKIMYPRKDEDKKKARISGFICFENIEDAENAKDSLDGVEMCGNIIRIGWSKAIPKYGYNIKNEICNYNIDRYNTYNNMNVNKKIIIIIPDDKKTKRIIDLLAKYVTEEGYSFEETIKEKEKDNPNFHFLFESSDLFYYYKWRVFSFAQGDSYKNWRTDPFHMFSNGYLYVPPSIEKKNKALLIKRKRGRNKRGHIDQKKKNKLINILSTLNKKRVSICRAMIFCTRHSDYSLDIIKIISSFLTDMKYDLLRKINLIYLLSDILYNCSNEFFSSWSYRKHIEDELPKIFYFLRKHIKKVDSKIKGKMFTDSLINIFNMWNTWAIYNSVYMNGLLCLLFNMKINYINDNKSDEEKGDENIDGHKIQYYDDIKRYPLSLRRNAYMYFQKDENEINKLCLQRGLYYDEHFTKKKKIKFLLLYDNFCLKNNLSNTNNNQHFINNYFFSR
ncbi:U2 snRNP-associated SURP motif-containing protein, putative [Plasmodium sp. gorilla clade G2]|uniref:U2 snRNP-associated SURP motif-containing protein, putative n=1 Tax=Plasmodium sp. gorilla clade G2 TaxID=880535 RepID=UPI000D2016C1|nr:U2 snRNP-associated SURP motif-containing protein, putative [Plasmodium sp. gorilla clade G2]SOV18565.1 U2 snRNP-associated SURP motif-containing protein, putative [Plasmodium sp. gorilla clade G2]